MIKTAFIYSDDFATYDYGATHPLKPFRLKLTCELMKAYGLLNLPNTQVIKPIMAEEADLLMFHDESYIDILKILNSGRMNPVAEFFGIGPGDNPIFKGLYDWSRLVTGASLQAASLVASGEVDIAFNIAGGLHHAMSTHASGFCYINDPVIAIMSLLKKGYKVAYVDIDAHHGDGVQNAFYKSSSVLTISIHETGKTLFPGTGFENEIGEGNGLGFSVNIPMPPLSDDDLFMFAFNEIVPPIIKQFQPDIVVSQFGVDTFYNDPLAHLNYTNNGFCEVVKKIKEISPGLVALGGGGYNMANVARAWTLAWAIMNEIEIPDEIPEEYFDKYTKYDFHTRQIKDITYNETGPAKKEMREEVERVVRFIKENVFKYHNI
ncbi:MAG: acetoin utilization protein AcuC [Nitrospira sp.]|nr:acetoin utilization protein AcuC [Nitrospira sp.]